MRMLLSNYTAWILAFHILAVIAWMAGMLYLPRLFVYHSEQRVGSETSELLKVWERNLLKRIVTPAMIAVWVLGLTLAWVTGTYADTWLQIKLVFVLGLSGLHGFFAGSVRRFANDANTRPTRFWRMINEVPFLFAIVIVILAVVKPFS
jgi:putative membrane protein